MCGPRTQAGGAHPRLEPPHPFSGRTDSGKCEVQGRVSVGRTLRKQSKKAGGERTPKKNPAPLAVETPSHFKWCARIGRMPSGLRPQPTPPIALRGWEGGRRSPQHVGHSGLSQNGPHCDDVCSVLQECINQTNQCCVHMQHSKMRCLRVRRITQNLKRPVFERAKSGPQGTPAPKRGTSENAHNS